MNIYFINAQNLLASIDDAKLKPTAQQALKELDSLHKQGGIIDLLNSPFIMTALGLLAPFVKNWKIKQAVKLLQEGIEEEAKSEKAKEKKRL